MTNVVWAKWRNLDNEARARAACYPRLAVHFLCDVSGELIPLAPVVLQSCQEATHKDLTSHPTLQHSPAGDCGLSARDTTARQQPPSPLFWKFTRTPPDLPALDRPFKS